MGTCCIQCKSTRNKLCPNKKSFSKYGFSPSFALMSRNAHDDKNGRFGERAARSTILAKLAILAIFCQFRQISSSFGIDTTRVNIGNVHPCGVNTNG